VATTKSNTKEKKEISCFIIMPISTQEGYEAEHFTHVYEDIIKPAVEKAGMVPIRADEAVNTNLIQLDILRKVIESDIAICDMSSKNPNVFYELGVRQAFDKPTVLMIDDKTSAPFDVSSLRYIDYKQGMKYRDVNLTIDRLTESLLDTYAKKEDRSEINSLIRLMELTSPAQLTQVDLSDEARTAKLQEIQVTELTSMIHSLQVTQLTMLEQLKHNPVRKAQSDSDKTRQFLRNRLSKGSDSGMLVNNDEDTAQDMV